MTFGDDNLYSSEIMSEAQAMSTEDKFAIHAACREGQSECGVVPKWYEAADGPPAKKVEALLNVGSTARPNNS